MRAIQQTVASFLNLFVVKSSSGSNVPYLDGIRSIAVMLIVIRHSWVLSGNPNILITMPVAGNVINLTPIFTSTYTGVDLFFVLSGFLLSQTWLKADFLGESRPSTSKYFKQRFFRIAPAYYACLFLLLLFFTPTYIPPETIFSQQGAFVLGAHLLFMQYIFPVSSSSYVVDGALWTLTMEMTFYLLLPWLIYVFLKNRWMFALPAMTLVTLGWLYLSKHSLDPLVQFWVNDMVRFKVGPDTIRYFLSKQFPAHLTDFGLGMALANLYVRYRLNYQPSRWFKVVTGRTAGNLYFFLGWFIVIYSMNKISSDPTPLFSYYLTQISVSLGFTMALAGLLFGGGWSKTLFSNWPMRFIGLIGYSVFLWHMPMIYLFNSYPGIKALAPEQRFPTVLLAASLACLVLCSGFYLAIEKPFMLLGRRRKPASIDAPVAVPALSAEVVVSKAGD